MHTQPRAVPQQLSVVGEHLLEVRNHPGTVRGVAGEAAVELVEKRRTAHRLEGADREPAGHVRWLSAGSLLPAGLLQQEREQRRGRELRGSPEPAMDGVLLGGEHSQRRLHPLLGLCPGLRAWAGVLGREECQLRLLSALDAQRASDLLRGLLDLLAALRPGGVDGVEHLGEGRDPPVARRREIGARVEGASVRQNEDAHRPAALPGEGLSGGHVGVVDVGVLLPIHLDRHEAGVQRLRGASVREGLGRHHMTPVAGGVADGDEDRHIPSASLLEGLRAPRMPVHGVLGVLP